jgi:hypothetical protein
LPVFAGAAVVPGAMVPVGFSAGFGGRGCATAPVDDVVALGCPASPMLGAGSSSCEGSTGGSSGAAVAVAEAAAGSALAALTAGGGKAECAVVDA